MYNIYMDIQCQFSTYCKSCTVPSLNGGLSVTLRGFSSTTGWSSEGVNTSQLVLRCPAHRPWIGLDLACWLSLFEMHWAQRTDSASHVGQLHNVFPLTGPSLSMYISLVHLWCLASLYFKLSTLIPSLTIQLALSMLMLIWLPCYVLD